MIDHHTARTVTAAYSKAALCSEEPRSDGLPLLVSVISLLLDALEFMLE